jgi:hypothetical protein
LPRITPTSQETPTALVLSSYEFLKYRYLTIRFLGGVAFYM